MSYSHSHYYALSCLGAITMEDGLHTPSLETRRNAEFEHTEHNHHHHHHRYTTTIFQAAKRQKHLLMHKKRQNKKPNVGLEPTASRSPDIEVLRATIAPAGLICRVDVSIDIYWLHRMCVELGPSSRFHWLEIAEIKPSHVARRTPKLSIIETVASYYTLHTSAQTLL
jgi:hypothetical protein